MESFHSAVGELLCVLVTRASNTEANKSHWKIMVECKSTHSKSQISDVKKKKKKRALTNWDSITATLRNVLLNPPRQATWLATGGTVLLEKQRKKGRGEENWNKETVIKTVNFKFGGHLIYPLLEAGIHSLPFFLEYKIKQ